MLNRTLSPELQPIQKIHFVEPVETKINDFASIFHIAQVPDETVRLEMHFHAGQMHGIKNMSSFTSSLLLSGTNNKTSEQIHEELNQLGAFVDHEISMELAFVSLFCLRKNVQKAFEILLDAVIHVEFKEHEIQDTIQEKKQRFLVSKEKVSFLARREFQKQLFSSSENYSRMLEMEDFEHIKRSDLVDFHNKYYLKGLIKVIVVGNLDETFITFLKSSLTPYASQERLTYLNSISNNKGEFLVQKNGTVQSAIRVGIPVFNKKNPDYFAFQVMQTILGDYFGSRLMSNIREDKGYTYGIGCTLVEMKEIGYFVIATEVGKEVTQETIKEIKYEIELLKNELVSFDEIELVRNYLLGQLLKSADGPNAIMDLFLSVHQHHLNLEFYNDFILKIETITVEEIKEMANKYLDWKNFTLVIAGEHN
jgi:predicted Zn-dependent peptidase